MNKYIKELVELKFGLNFSDPFFYSFLSLIGVDFDKRNETACIYRIDNFLNISINPDFWDVLNNKERLFILKHELYHLILKHPTQAFDNFNLKIFGIAADFYINNILSNDNNINMPNGGLMYNLPEFSELNLTKEIVNSGTIPIYNHLLNYQEKLDKLNLNHNWDSFKNNANIVDGQINNMLQNINKICSNIPQNIKNIIKNINEKYNKEINYKKIIKKIANNVGYRSYIKRSTLKDHQFYSDSDGFRIKYKGTIPIIVDTSGSMMNANDIQDVCDQLLSIAKQANVCLKVIECDMNVTDKSIWVYNSKKDLRKRIKNGFIGGGGTMVDPAINYINQKLKDTKLTIYLTDGYVSPPKVNHNYKVVVVLTRNSVITPNELLKSWGNNYTILKIK